MIKRLFKYFMDGIVVNVAVAMAIFLGCELDFAVAIGQWRSFVLGVPLLGISFIALMYFLGGYRVLWQWAGTRDRYIFAFKAVISALPYTLVHSFVAPQPYSVSVYIYSVILIIVGLQVLRTCYKWIAKRRDRKSGPPQTDAPNAEADRNKINVMIVGAGSAGNMLLQNIKNNPEFQGWHAACFVDDSDAKIGKTFGTVTIVGNCDSIPENVKKHNISLIIFAIPSCSNQRRAQILNICNSTGCKIKTLPSIGQMMDGNVGVKDIREVQVEDLLGRDPVSLDAQTVKSFVEGKTVMVTGGGGSIGSELCRQLAEYGAQKLIIFDIYENNAYDIQNELKTRYPALELETLIGSVRDADRLSAVMEKYRPQVVYHAAAHKHVPLMEDSPNEAVKNNVFGTLNAVRAADKWGVERFILISTDKAVNPTNVMGATKRICEMIVQSYNRRSKTEYAAVRFGNVLGSNGSVIPLFKKQIAAGGPVTVTDPEIIRYFMTIPEAVSLVLEAGVHARGGEIFVLDMGQPVKILTLAENLIRLMGYTPYEDISIEFTGLRPGEKLYEEMLMKEEGLKDTANHLIYIGKPIELDEEHLFSTLEKIEAIMKDDDVDIRSYIEKLVPTYRRDRE